MRLIPSPLRPEVAAAFGRSTAASEQTPMACRRTATDAYVEKNGRGAGGACAAGGRVTAVVLVDVTVAVLRPKSAVLRTAEGRSTAGSKQTCVMWSEQLEMIA